MLTQVFELPRDRPDQITGLEAGVLLDAPHGRDEQATTQLAIQYDDSQSTEFFDVLTTYVHDQKPLQERGESERDGDGLIVRGSRAMNRAACR